MPELAAPAAPTGAVLTGVGVGTGIGVGPVLRVVDSVPEPPAGGGGDPATDRARAAAALEAVAADLEARGERAGGEARDVLDAQALMARDPGLAEDVGRRIDAGSSAARATHDAFLGYRAVLAAAGEYLAARVADLDDVRDRTVARLLGLPAPGVPPLREPVVIVARDLAPADTALLDPALVRALVTEQGGPTSHTAILARALGVPAVVACPGATAVPPGTLLLVDAGTGTVRVDPPRDEVTAAGATARRRASVPATGGHGPGRTADGHPVALLGNVAGPADAAAAAAAGAEGVGLFRTELCFLDRTDAPGVKEQAAVYRDVLRHFRGRRVVVRVLDAGADKPLPFLSRSRESNPALGLRGIRLLRAHPEVLATQLAALLAANEGADGAGADLHVMAPMVADAEEARWFTAACRRAGIRGPVGVMVEVPSAALGAAGILTAADFLSVGSNDLAQYTFAADRQLGDLAALQDPWQPPLLELIALAAGAAQRVGRPCGVCGEAAADPALACVLTGLGVTSLSTGAAALAGVRAALSAHTIDRCRAAAAAARAAPDPAAARAAACAELPRLAELGL